MRAEEGSTASTATLWPRSISIMPSTSMVVDLPTPGEPVMPTRIGLPVSRQQRLHQFARRGLMIGAPALDQRDRARQRRAVA